MKFFPVKIFYETDQRTGDLVVWLCGRDETGARRTIPLFGTEPYFYTDEVPHEHEKMTRVELNSSRDLWGKPVHRVYTKYPYDVPEVRATFAVTYEADVVYDRRIRFDLGIRNCITIPDGDIQRLLLEDISPVDGDIEPRIATLDIETYFKGRKGGGNTAAYPTDPVNCVSLKDSKTKKFATIFLGKLTPQQEKQLFLLFAEHNLDVRLFQVEDELRLFLRLQQVLSAIGPDIVRGWNLELFDWTYLQNRQKQRELGFLNWNQYEVFDSMENYVKIHSRAKGLPKDGKSLDAVAYNEGVGQKVKYEGSIAKLYEEDPVKFIFYNVWDVELADRIDEKAFGGVTRYWLNIAREAGCSLNDTKHEMRVVDAYVTHRMQGKMVQLTKGRSAGASHKISGGKVFDPVMGVHRLVVQADNSQEYTAIFRSFNLSPETLVRDAEVPDSECIISPNGNRYTKKFRGVFPQILDEISAKMTRYKTLYKQTGDIVHEDKRQATKNINHSFFGCMKNEHYRNRDADIAGDITSIGQIHVSYNKTFLEREDPSIRVVYGDTDSSYFYFDGAIDRSEVEKRAHAILEKLNASYPAWAKEKFNVDDCHLKVGYEGIADRILFLPTAKEEDDEGAKKRYVYVTVPTPKEIERGVDIIERDDIKWKMVVKGAQSRRSDSCPFTREAQAELFRTLLFAINPAEEARRLVRGWMEGVRSGAIPIEALRVPKGLTKDPEDYDTNTEQSRAAKFSNEHLGKNFSGGDKISIYFGRIQGKPVTDVFALDWSDKVPPEAVIDIDNHVRRGLALPLGPVLSMVGLTFEEAASDYVSQKVGDLM